MTPRVIIIAGPNGAGKTTFAREYLPHEADCTKFINADLSHVREWQAIGYRVHLVFLRLRSVNLAIARVKDRVTQGGHDVPAGIIRRRFRSGLLNFERLYRPLVDHWELYDNSGARPVLIERGEKR